MFWICVWAVIKLFVGLLTFELDYWNASYLRQCLKNAWKHSIRAQSSFLLSWFPLGLLCLQVALEVLKLHQLPVHFQVQIKMEFSAISPNNISFHLHSLLHLCSFYQRVFFICCYFAEGLSSAAALKPTVCSSFSLLTFELCSRGAFQD